MINRANAPVITIPSKVKVKEAIIKDSASGVPLHILQFDEYDVVRISFVFRAGVKYQTKPFMASATAGMLSEGGGDLLSRDISEIFDFYGIYYDQTVDRDYSVITLCALDRFISKGLDVLDKILTAPTFPEEEFSILKTKRKQSIAIQRSKIDFVARENFAKSLFGANHHYGQSYSEDEYDNLSTDDIKSYHEKQYCRENLFVVMSGKFSQEYTDKIDSIISKLPKGEQAVLEVKELDTTKDKFIQWKDANQSVIRIGRLLFTRSHPDFVPMQVLVTVLGGYFGSRLISNLREEKGYTYGIFAGLINLEEQGYMAISTEVECGVTDEAVKEIFFEIERLRTELIPATELNVVKSVMIGEIMRILDGPFGIADITIENVLTQRDNSYLHEQVKEIMTITPEQLLSMAQKYFNRDEFITLVVGERENNG